MEYCHTLKKKALVVRIAGEVDMHTAPSLKEYLDTLLATYPTLKHLVLDLEEVRFIDSSGLGVILGRYKVIARRGGELVFFRSSPQIQRLLELSGFGKIARFAKTERQALENLQG